MTFVYTLTIFTSAFLLFLIQPMISKLLLPHLGGSPAVWNTSMMFFQTFLLLGYLYTHLTGKWLGPKKQSVLHIILLLVALAWLPISLKTDINFSSSEHPISWVILSLFLSVGVPFFVLAANAPLIQFWMANTSHKDAKNPYFLYSASNVASLVALLGYPFLIEPALTLSGQTQAWSNIFVGFVLLIAACAWYLKKNYRPVAAEAATDSSAAPTARTKLYWVALAFAPSSLMLGLTSFITTDIASMPLFWVIPLALYLITFILAFGRHHIKITDYALKLQTILVPLTVFVMIFEIRYLYIVMGLHVLTFFVTTMVCHGILAGRKPSPKYLTEFYVWMSFGGMLGGTFNALIAPNIFSSAIEYYIVFVLCLLLRPTLAPAADSKRELKRDVLLPAAFTLVLFFIFSAALYSMSGFMSFVRGANTHEPQSLGAYAPMLAGNMQFVLMVFVYLIIMLAVDKSDKRSLRFTLIVISIFIAIKSSVYTYRVIKGYEAKSTAAIIYTHRNFFGITRIASLTDNISMMHGTTRHGFQNKDPKNRLALTSYYAPLRETLKYLDQSLTNAPYAVIGLGTGTSACVGHKGQTVDFYDIDPDIVKMASNPALFTYLRDCPTQHNIILGDGRLMIAKAEDKRYGLIVVDAFNSDSIPIHLLTREALAIYRSKLADKGVIAFHVSNRHLNLAKVTAALAHEANLHALYINYVPKAAWEGGSNWVMVTNDSAYYSRLKHNNPEWELLLPGTLEPVLWTDDYSNIFQTLY